jgi:hypothetical protein
MEIDRSRFQRKKSMSRGSSTYVPSGSWSGSVAIPQQIAPVPQAETIVEPPAIVASPPAPSVQEAVPTPIPAAPMVVLTQRKTPASVNAKHPARQPQYQLIKKPTPMATPNLLDDDGVDFDQWARGADYLDATAQDPVASAEPAEAVRAARPQRQRRSKARRLSIKKPAIYGAGVIALFCMSIGIGVLSGSRASHDSQAPSQATTSQQSSPQQVSDTGNTAGGLSVSPASNALNASQSINGQMQGTSTGVGATQYSDTYLGGKINITIQKMPDNFNADPAAALKEFANNLKADTVVQTKYGAAYVLTKTDVQVVTFVANSKLVLFQSFGVHTSDEWKAYIEGMSGL